MAKGSASRILPDEANGAAVHQQGTDCQGLCHAPVDGVVGNHLRTALQLGWQPCVDREILGHGELRVDHDLDQLTGESRI
ncbi:MAG: hypothetical protein ACKOE2_01660, partial [Actinomycetales bacterium]